MDVSSALAAIFDERERQRQLWGGGPGDCSHPSTKNDTRLCILVEEIGEIAHAMNENDTENLKEELVQSAAVILAWLEGIE